MLYLCRFIWLLLLLLSLPLTVFSYKIGQIPNDGAVVKRQVVIRRQQNFGVEYNNNANYQQEIAANNSPEYGPENGDFDDIMARLRHPSNNTNKGYQNSIRQQQQKRRVFAPTTPVPSFFELKHREALRNLSLSLAKLSNNSANNNRVIRISTQPKPHIAHRQYENDYLPPPQPAPAGAANWRWNLRAQRPTITVGTLPQEKTPMEQRLIDMLQKKIRLGEVVITNNMANMDFLAGYGLKQTFSLRYSPPPKSEPWPMPQIFIGYEELYSINPSQLDFNIPSSCETLRNIVDRYKKGLLFQSARRIAIEDAILHPGVVYSPSADFPLPPLEKNFTDNNSFFQRKVVTRMKTASTTKKWTLMDISVKSIKITISKCSEFPTENSKETYGLRVTHTGITIFAAEVWGVLYALETLSQLIFSSSENNNQFMVRAATVEDWPRFQHRGLLLDSSRHFLPVPLLKQNINAMVQNKFNVFHWHISDDQSFPLYLKSFPNFAKNAAYSPDQIYTPDDVAEIVEFARLRGVRVMPEIDSPGHVFSWRHLGKDIMTRCYENGMATGDLGPLDPTNEETYKVLRKIFNDVGQLFPDAAFHAGGDEVPQTCWNSNPNITDYRRKNFSITSTTPSVIKNVNFTNNNNSDSPYQQSEPSLLSIQEVVAAYNRRLLNIFKASRPTVTKTGEEPFVVMWEEAYENDPTLSRNVTLHVWKNGQNKVRFLIDEGFDVLFSQCWYLNYINYGIDWTKFYQCDPTTMGLRGASLSNDDHGILGGEVCMWGEYIDETNLMSTLWPRASAAGERLWSNRNVMNVDEAGRRLEEHRCRMMRRGIPAAPVSGPGSCEGFSGFVSATELWLQEVQPSSSSTPVKRHSTNVTAEGDFSDEITPAEAVTMPTKKPPTLLVGSRAALYYYGESVNNNNVDKKNNGAVVTIRIDFSENLHSEISLDATSLYLLGVIVVLLLLIWLTTRRSGLKYFRPLVFAVRSFGLLSRKSGTPISSNNSFISATPSPRVRSSYSSSSATTSSAGSYYSKSTSSSVVKQQNLD